MSGPGGYQRFLAELKRRNVFKVAGVYGIVAFVLVQIADLLFPALLLPDAMFRGFVVMLLLGFPLALVFAWAFETTPEGIRRTEVADTGEITEIIRQPAASRWPSGLLAVAGAAMLVVGAALALKSGRGTDTAAGATDADAAGVPATQPPGAGAAEGRRSTGPADVDHLTIAVLPFENMSGDDTSAVFTAGVHDDIITQLSKISALRVTSRTSVREYADSEKRVGEIASELGVANVLEGGVRRAGRTVRINVQLIDAATDVHLWAQGFDRELTAENVFQIQSEIARSVAAALEAELTSEEASGLREVPTRSLAALEAYHRGMAGLSGVSEDMTRRAVAELERAVELDPGFGLAWAGLTRAQSWLLRTGRETDPTAALQSLERARHVAPAAPETHLAAGFYDYYAIGDYELALEEFEAAEAAMPNSADVLAALGYVHRRLGHWDESLLYTVRSVDLDPRNAAETWNLANTEAMTGDFGAAARRYQEAIRIEPDAEDANWFGFRTILWGLADSAAAVEHLRSVRPLLDPELMAAMEAELALVRRDYTGAITALESAGPDSTLDFLGYPQVAAGYGDGRLLRLAKLYYLAGDLERARFYADSMDRLSREAIRDRSRVRAGKRDLFGREAIAHARLGLALALLGEKDDAIREGERAVALFPVSYDATDGSTVSIYLAQILTIVGEHERAIAELADIRSQPSLLFPGHLRLDPIYDPLREDPRFRALAQVE